MKLMTISVPFKALYHDIEGGGYWAEIKELPGCVAQADDLETLEKNLIRAIADWFRERPEKTEEEARQLAAIQGTTFKEGRSQRACRDPGHHLQGRGALPAALRLPHAF